MIESFIGVYIAHLLSLNVRNQATVLTRCAVNRSSYSWTKSDLTKASRSLMISGPHASMSLSARYFSSALLPCGTVIQFEGSSHNDTKRCKSSQVSPMQKSHDEKQIDRYPRDINGTFRQPVVRKKCPLMSHFFSRLPDPPPPSSKWDIRDINFERPLGTVGP